MNGPDLDVQDRQFEAELRKLRPAAAPENLVRRLIAAQPRPGLAPSSALEPAARAETWIAWLGRWWLPAGSFAALGLAVAILARTSPVAPLAPHTSVESPAPLLADDVTIERNLVASYEAVARFPDGVPVRLAFQEWEDTVKFRDSSRGITVERSVPRLEVTPVSFETD